MEKPSLAPSFWRGLAGENPLGIELDEQDARDWFDLVWSRYRKRNYTRHRTAIENWWSRLDLKELQRARDRGRRLREGSAGPIPFPRRFTPEQKERMRRFASRSGLSRGQLNHAARVVQKHAEKSGKLSEDWCADLELAMLRGWALDGFDRDRRRGFVNEQPQESGWRDNTLGSIQRELRLVEGGKE